MRRFAMRVAAVAAGTTVAAAGMAVSTTMPARASTCAGVTIRSANGGTIRLHQSRRAIGLTLNVSTSTAAHTWYLTGGDVYRGSKKVGTIPSGAAGSGTKHLNLTNFRSSWGRGDFTVRHLHIESFTSSGVRSTCTMTPRSHFRVLSDVGGTLKYHGRFDVDIPWTGGSKHTFKVGLRYYGTHGWVRFKHHLVKIQMKRSGHWRTIKRLRTDQRGKARWVGHFKTRHRYRLTWKGTSTITGGKVTNPYAI